MESTKIFKKGSVWFQARKNLWKTHFCSKKIMREAWGTEKGRLFCVHFSSENDNHVRLTIWFGDNCNKFVGLHVLILKVVFTIPCNFDVINAYAPRHCTVSMASFRCLGGIKNACHARLVKLRIQRWNSIINIIIKYLWMVWMTVWAQKVWPRMFSDSDVKQWKSRLKPMSDCVNLIFHGGGCSRAIF